MKYWAFLLVLACAGVGAEQRVDAEGKPCEPLVDLSESGDFHRLHFECDEQPKVVNTYESEDEAKAAPLEGAAPDATGVAKAPGTEVLIRSGLARDGEMLETLADLYQQMQRHCPTGWEKDREWAAQDAGQLYLHARITCTASK